LDNAGFIGLEEGIKKVYMDLLWKTY
jgi:hypothetical protein